jgi:Rha family phage regulatory protein
MELAIESQPILREVGGRILADSRDVAAFFGREHKNVLAAIRDMIGKEPSLGELNFQPFKTKDLTGESTSHFEMDRDGFTLLAMGFTGAKALKWKLRYIEAFNAMESELRARPRAMIDFTDPKVLLGCLEHLQGQVKQRDAMIAEQGERLVKLDRIEGSAGSMCISTAAKTLKVAPLKNLFATMQAHRWIFKRPNSSDWLAREDKRRAGYLEHADYQYTDSAGQERVRSRVLVTAKGLVKLAELLSKPKH